MNEQQTPYPSSPRSGVYPYNETSQESYSQNTPLDIAVADKTPPSPSRDSRHTAIPLSREAPLPEVLKFLNDPIHAIVVQALSSVGTWQPREGFAYAYRGEYGGAQITIGLPLGANVEKYWQFLKDGCPSGLGNPILLKGHFALWAHYYERVDGGSNPYIEMSVSQLCGDVGYKKHQAGGFRLEHRRRALEALEVLSAIEIRAVKQFPQKKIKLTGNLWTRGITQAQAPANAAGDSQWQPVHYSFIPGPWFNDPEWKKHTRFLGKIGSGFSRLSNHNDEWAIYIAAYLAVTMRSNGYRSLRLQIGTLLHRAGLGQSARARKKKTELRDKLAGALDRLKDVHIIDNWDYEGISARDIDMDDAAQVAEYGSEDIYPPGDWRTHIISIIPPFEEDKKRLKSATDKSVLRNRKAKGKKAESRAPDSTAVKS